MPRKPAERRFVANPGHPIAGYPVDWTDRTTPDPKARLMCRAKGVAAWGVLRLWAVPGPGVATEYNRNDRDRASG